MLMRRRTWLRHTAACPRCRTWLAEAQEDEALLGDVRRVIGEIDNGFSHVAGTPPPQSEQPMVGEVTAFVSFVDLVLADGRIFEAEQLEPRRRVAIKIVRDGP